MKHTNNHSQPSKSAYVLPLAKKWWKQHPEANLLDIQNAIEKITQVPSPKVQAAQKQKKGLFGR